MMIPIVLFTMATLLLLAENAAAYIGPGASIGAIATVIALVGAVLLGIVGFVWYPIKRLLGKRNNAKSNEKREQELTQS